MNKKFFFYLLSICLGIIFSTSSCNRDKSDDSQLSELDIHINDFIWTGLHDYYLWVDDVPELSYSNFPSESSYEDYLNAYSDHEEIFYSLLYKYQEVDRFSWIVDNYVDLENLFAGISKSMGFEFQLGRISGTNNLFGVVIYVLKGTPAEAAGLKRGDLFVEVNSQDITEDNYQTLLFENETYTLTLASVSNNTLQLTGKTATMTAVEITENPIYLDTVYNISGKNIGYMVFNGFISGYESQLNSVFSKFKAQNISDLVLDLRYNPGGAVSTATYLASMICTTDTNKVFITEKYNTGLQEYIDENFGKDYSIINFADKFSLSESTATEPIISLGLKKIYIITTYNSASASELVISGLKPYMDVVTVGSTTYGKYVGSFTVYDYDRQGNIRTDHAWAMQPIVMKAANANGESDYVNGFEPTIAINEDVANLSSFGNINEPLLNKALTDITGGLKSAVLPATSDFKSVQFGFSKDRNRFAREMFVPNPFQKDKK